MIAAMAVFAIEDAFVKAAAVSLPIAQVLMIFGAGGALIFAAQSALNRKPLYTPAVASRPMRVRVFFEIVGRLFYVLAIALIPLSAATVILQATPLVVVAGAAVIFGENVGWRRWTAILIGMSGVLVIIQPGADSFSALSILAVIGMIGFAGRDLASRAAPASLSTSLLGLYGFLSIILAGAMFAIWEQAAFKIPDTQTTLYLTGSIIAGVTAYSCLMKAMRTGEVSAVTPFRYTRLIFGVALGVMAFNETLTTPMLIGSGLIVCSGLFILWRGKKAA
ncbi:MAG: DMT family transporter [Pikeienuella sp.]